MKGGPSLRRFRNPINVVVPVYLGALETTRCLDSVIAGGLPEDVYLTIINDASPDPEIQSLLSRYANSPGVTLLTNERNLGFVGTANRGMSQRTDADVVLLNSDTEVPFGWLNRLNRCAYAEADVGTVTPFSNNATICSYPKFCSDNSLPEGYSIAALDALFQEVNAGRSADIPTAVGFCMYVRRDCLDEVGLFDEMAFGKGYGEENDFSLRAARKGWRNVLCADLFVFHAGAVSFAGERDDRAKNALRLLAKRYPTYASSVQRHIQKDPVKHFRHRVDLLRLTRGKKRVVLLISHRLGGGVVKHEQELAASFSREVGFLRLTPRINGEVEVTWYHQSEGLRLIFQLPRDWLALVELLRCAGVTRIHVHHLLDVPEAIQDLPHALGVPYDFTVHDFYAICPRITLTDAQNTFCGQPREAVCRACLKDAAAHQRDIRAWRSSSQQFLEKAARVFAPSADTARRMTSVLKLDNLVVAPHADVSAVDCPVPNHQPLAAEEPLRIVVFGALSAIKGADLLEAVALESKQKALPLEFSLIGYAWRSLVTEPNSRLTVSGAYRDVELQELLAAARPHVIWFPALWPETYSYTLSAALRSGLPVVAPDLGAFPERLANRPWTWLCPWDRTPIDWAAFFLDTRKAHFLTGVPPTPTQVQRPVFVDWMPLYLSAGKERQETLSLAQAILFADNYTAPRLSLMRRLSLSVRGELLRLGLIARSLPMLSVVVRRIPMGWQYRVRHWLMK